LASNGPRGNDTSTIQSLAVTRQTIPPSQPVLEAPTPVYRGSFPGQSAADDYSNPAIRPAAPSATYNLPQQNYIQTQQPQGAIRLGAPLPASFGSR